MKYQPVKQGDTLVLNDGVHVAVHVSIKKTLIFLSTVILVVYIIKPNVTL